MENVTTFTPSEFLRKLTISKKIWGQSEPTLEPNPIRFEPTNILQQISADSVVTCVFLGTKLLIFIEYTIRQTSNQW